MSADVKILQQKLKSLLEAADDGILDAVSDAEASRLRDEAHAAAAKLFLHWLKVDRVSVEDLRVFGERSLGRLAGFGSTSSSAGLEPACVAGNSW